MTFMPQLIDTIASHFSSVYVDMLFRGAALLCGAWLLTLALRRASAALRHAVWTAAFVGVALLPVFSALLPTWSLEVFRERSVAVNSRVPLRVPSRVPSKVPSIRAHSLSVQPAASPSTNATNAARTAAPTEGESYDTTRFSSGTATPSADAPAQPAGAPELATSPLASTSTAPHTITEARVADSESHRAAAETAPKGNVSDLTRSSPTIASSERQGGRDDPEADANPTAYETISAADDRAQATVAVAQARRRHTAAGDVKSALSLLRPVSWSTVTFGVFLLGSLTLLLRLAVAVGRVTLLVRRAAVIENDSRRDALDAAAGRLALRRPLVLLESPLVGVPMVWNPLPMGTAYVLIPNDAATWPTSKLRLVFLHELAHVRRSDGFWRLGARFVTALSWPNPLAWFALRRLELESELACDDAVIASGCRASAYADELLAIATRDVDDRFAHRAAVAMARPGRLEGRLLALLDTTRSRAALSARGLALLLVGLIAGTAPLAMMQAGTEDEGVFAAADAATDEAADETSSHDSARRERAVEKEVAEEPRVAAPAGVGAADEIAVETADGEPAAPELAPPIAEPESVRPALTVDASPPAPTPPSLRLVSPTPRRGTTARKGHGGIRVVFSGSSMHVHFVGLAAYPSGETWWSPDGRHQIAPVYEVVGADAAEGAARQTDQRSWYQAAVRVCGAPSRLRLTATVANDPTPVEAIRTTHREDYWGFIFSVPVATRETSLRLDFERDSRRQESDAERRSKNKDEKCNSRRKRRAKRSVQPASDTKHSVELDSISLEPAHQTNPEARVITQESSVRIEQPAPVVVGVAPHDRAIKTLPMPRSLDIAGVPPTVTHLLHNLGSQPAEHPAVTAVRSWAQHAFAGEDEAAPQFVAPGASVTASDLRSIDVARLVRIKSGYANDRAALLITGVVVAQGRDPGVLVLRVVRFDEHWLVHDVDLASKEEAAEQIEGFQIHPGVQPIDTDDVKLGRGSAGAGEPAATVRLWLRLAQAGLTDEAEALYVKDRETNDARRLTSHYASEAISLAEGWSSDARAVVLSSYVPVVETRERTRRKKKRQDIFEPVRIVTNQHHVLIFHLQLVDGGWLIDDVDFSDPDVAQQRVKGFRGYPGVRQLGGVNTNGGAIEPGTLEGAGQFWDVQPSEVDISPNDAPDDTETRGVEDSEAPAESRGARQ